MTDSKLWEYVEYQAIELIAKYETCKTNFSSVRYCTTQTIQAKNKIQNIILNEIYLLYKLYDTFKYSCNITRLIKSMKKFSR
jgi:hypothetical protein